MAESDPKEREIDDVVAEYVSRLQRGEDLEPEAIIAEHPTFGAEVVRQLEVFVGVEEAPCPDVILGVLGDYHLRRQIGRGGMGVVYEAWQNSLDRRVALKVLPAGVAADDRAFHRFMREAKTTAKLNHSHIVGVYGMGVEQNTPYYAMELVEGETLAQVLANLKTTNRDVATPFGKKDELNFFLNTAKAFASVADGLQHAHAKGVIHRDIKPSNLILDTEGRLRILDFGLARLEGQESLTISGEVVGTPFYMSPEQARRKRILVDHRTDIYSLGATLYELTTLLPPFSGKDHQDTLSQIIERDPVEPRKLNPRLPKDLETIVLKCLRKNPAERYGTAEAMGQDLMRFLRGDPIEARPQSAWDRTWRRAWRARKRLTVAILLGLLILCACAFGMTAWQRQKEEKLAQYEKLLLEGIAGLEAGLKFAPGERKEADDLVLGILYPSDLGGWFEDLAHLRTLHEHGVQLLRLATQLAPRRSEAQFHLARGLFALGDAPGAGVASRAAARCEPSFVPAVVLLARQAGADPDLSVPERLLTALEASAGAMDWQRPWLHAYRAARAGDWNEVERKWSEVIELGTLREPYGGFLLEYLLRRGRLRLHLGKTHEALRDFITASVRTPQVVTPLLLVAATYHKLELREQAAGILEEAAARFTSREALVAIAETHLKYGELERALTTIDALPERQAIAARVKLLRKSGSLEEAVAAARAAAVRGKAESNVYIDAAEALINLKRGDEAEDLLRQGLRAHPGVSALESFLNGRLAYFRGRHRELLDRELALPESRRNTDVEGWCAFRLGLLDHAMAALGRGIERDPRWDNSWSARGFMKARTGDHAGAIADMVQAIVLNQGQNSWNHEHLLEVWRLSRAGLFAPHWDRLHQALSAVGSTKLTTPRTLGLHALVHAYASQGDKEEALELATEAVKRTLGCDAEALCRLGEVHLVRGEHRAAWCAAERALDARGRPAGLEELISSCREALRQVVAPAAVLDTPQRTERFAAEEPTQCDRSLAAYLEACQWEEDGDDTRAGEILQNLVKESSFEEQQAVLRLARLWSRSHRRSDAMRLLESRLLEREVESLGSWETWLDIASGEGQRTLKSLLELPVLSIPLGTAPDEQGFRAEVRWVLDQLTHGGAIRINCGGADFIDPQGHKWSRDRFFEGGTQNSRFAPPLQGTDSPRLYYANRVFWPHCWLTPGYRIPLPRGSYALTLGFAVTEVYPWDWQFEILCEGQALDDDFNASAAGIGVVQTKTFEVDVNDGALEIVLWPKPWLSFVSTIEIQARTAFHMRSPPQLTR